MRRWRQRYYDGFARFYDRFVAMHSADHAERLRRWFCEKTALGAADRILDICTGTGSLLGHFHAQASAGGMVIGVDFSRNMLKVAQRKTRNLSRVFLIQADVAQLPFKARSFDAVTCTHAFYELKGRSQQDCLQELRRILKPGKSFVLMEHDLPDRPLIRALFYLRLLSMGASRAIEILRHEEALLARHFRRVEKIKSPSGRSKIIKCWS